MNEIQFKTKLTQQEYFKARISLIYGNWRMKFFTVIGFLLLANGPLNYTSTGRFSFQSIVMGLIFICIVPFTVYRDCRKVFKTNNNITEEVNYKISEELITIQGQSFKSELGWSTIYKITANKNWIFLYTSKQIANMIKKSDLSSTQYETLKSIVSRHNNVKSKL